MDQAYTTAKDIIADSHKELARLLEIAAQAAGADQAAHALISSLLDKMSAAEKELTYLGSQIKEGLLTIGQDEKYGIQFAEGGGYPLEVGSHLELFSDEEWHLGRVEARGGRYYFYGEGRPFMRPGMKARIRITDE